VESGGESILIHRQSSFFIIFSVIASAAKQSHRLVANAVGLLRCARNDSEIKSLNTRVGYSRGASYPGCVHV
jgi:hypothetical protein